MRQLATATLFASLLMGPVLACAPAAPSPASVKPEAAKPAAPPKAEAGKPAFKTVASHDEILEKAKQVPAAQVPKTWDDLLKPEWKGKKMVVDVRTSNIAPLVPEWGLEKTVDYARKLAAQEPIWDRGQTAALTKVAAGELAMHSFSNYHSALRAQAKACEQDIKVDLLEPIPIRISETLGVLKTAKRPYAGLLFLEYRARPEAQQILDDVEIKASIYGPGGKLKNVIEGKKVSVADYAHFEKMESYMAKIVEAFGFPKPELGK